jgi:hypothetical protein
MWRRRAITLLLVTVCCCWLMSPTTAAASLAPAAGPAIGMQPLHATDQQQQQQQQQPGQDVIAAPSCAWSQDGLLGRPVCDVSSGACCHAHNGGRLVSRSLKLHTDWRATHPTSSPPQKNTPHPQNDSPRPQRRQRPQPARARRRDRPVVGRAAARRSGRRRMRPAG